MTESLVYIMNNQLTTCDQDWMQPFFDDSNLIDMRGNDLVLTYNESNDSLIYVFYR